MVKTIRIIIEHDTDYPGEVLIHLEHGASGCFDYGVQETCAAAEIALEDAKNEALALIADCGFIPGKEEELA